MNYPSRTVASAPRPPTRSKGIYSPLLRGGGSRVSGAGEGLYPVLPKLHKYSFFGVHVNGFWNPSNYSLKALVSGCENMGFRACTQGFHSLKPMLLQMRSINFENCKQWSSICLQIKTFFTFIKLKIATLSFCIFMQFLVAGGRGTETQSYFGLPRYHTIIYG